MDISSEIGRLNPSQKEAVMHTEGPLLVLAGAGSGKTRVITMRTAYLLHMGVPPGSVLSVTFTNKAAREMKERVSSMVKNGRNNRPVISTFHSLCLTILRREIEHLGYRKDFTIFDTSEQLSLLRNILSDIKFHDRAFKIEAVLDRISNSKNDIRPSRDDASNPDDLDAITDVLYPKYREALKSLNALDFDDLLVLTVRLFREHSPVLERYRERFEYIMVDEYQDTNRVQYDFIKLLAGERRNLCVVGDDDQSIYGWRGADLGNILDFEKDFPGTVVVKLERNYRSAGHILQAANGVIKNNVKRMEKTLRTSGAAGPKVNIFKATDGEDEAKWTADRIELLKYEKKVSYEDVAVIYRANIFSRSFEEALRKKRIPYTVVGGTSYYERKEIKDLAAYLKIIANPHDDLSLLRAANVPRRGLGLTAINKLAGSAGDKGTGLLEAFANAGEIDGLGERPARAALELTAMIHRYGSSFKGGGGMAGVLRSLIEEIRYEEYIYTLYKTPEAAVGRIDNIQGFVDSLSQYEKEEATPSLHGFLETLALTDLLKEKEEKTGGGVTLISFHSSKGLEFPVVFIVGVEEDILPHKKSMGDVEEERRLFYVGITRAMRELYITHADHRVKYGKDAPSTPSRFLDEIPDETVKSLNGEDKTDPDREAREAEAFFANIRSMLGK